jgi:7,8-dihydropterin-6-yl-methyl-4-(beta-D-ribofuranosyl)aminobenzene 5'-phosphate synthase
LRPLTSGLRLTFLVDNSSVVPKLGVEHGLAVLLETSERVILFDTGQSDLLLANARLLGKDLSGVETVVLSHGHYDHSGGLQSVLELPGSAAEVLLHPAALESKFAVCPGKAARDIGMSYIPEIQHLRKVTGPHQICPGVLFLGQIPRVTDYEDTGGPFFRDQDGRIPDLLEDDSALLLSTASGLVLLTGCAHAGIVNVLRYAAGIANSNRFAAVLGGMHLKEASGSRMSRTVADLAEFEIEKIAAMHCSGEAAGQAFKDGLKAQVLECGAGSVFEY